MSDTAVETSTDARSTTERRALPPGTPDAPPPATRNHRRTVLFIGLIILVIGGVAGLLWYLEARHYEKTDDAFIDGHVVQISSRIAGHVLKVLVNDNQLVHAGDPLVQLDPAVVDKRIAEAEANLNAAKAQAAEARKNVELIQKTAAASQKQGEANVAVAKANVETANAAIAQAESQVTADQATQHKAELDLARYQSLLKSGDITQQQLDAAVVEADTAKARLAASQKAVVSARAQLQEATARVAAAEAEFAGVNVVSERTAVSERQRDTAEASIEQLQAALDRAKLDRSYTTINAPVDGRVTRRSVEPGHYVNEGESLFALVPTDLYVTANFKETQVTDMQPNQEVTVRVDAYPDRLLKAHVDSLQHGSGSRFSMLPPENATGNYVKVVQRIPVKIVFDEPLDAQRDYAPGMSVEPKVKVR